MRSTGPTRRRLLLAEDHADLAQALLRLLEIDFDILAVVTSGVDLVEHRLHFDLTPSSQTSASMA